MNILTIFTGGTIGSRISQSNESGRAVLNVPQEAGHRGYTLLDKYFESVLDKKANEVRFDTLEPLKVLSEDMTISEWNRLINAFKSVDFSLYDGIIVTHGTDTMSYSCALFSMLLAGALIPIVFVGSNFPLDDPRADGLGNFINAVDFISFKKFSGVFMTFKNQVFLGSRVKQSKHFCDSYDSASCEVFAVFDESEFVYVNQASNPCEKSLDKKAQDFREKMLINSVEELKDNIVKITPHVGLDYNIFNLDYMKGRIKGIVHETYHSFTACTAESCVSGSCEEAEICSSNNSILGFADRLKGIDIPIYISPCNIKDEIYSSLNKMSQNDNIFFLDTFSIESAYAKLLLAYNIYDVSDREKIKEFLEGDIFFEKTK